MAKPKTLAHKQALSRSLKGRDSHFKGKRHTIDSRKKISVGKSKYGMTFDKARTIRSEVAQGRTRKDVARKYGVTYGVVRDIVLGNSWIDVKPIAHASKPAIDF